jgi:hypothetical protein
VAVPSELTRSFAKMARENFRLRADIKVLAGILEMCATLRQPPEQWKKQWRQARETQAYRDTSEQFEPLLAKLETLADENEVLEILRKFPKSEFLN